VLRYLHSTLGEVPPCPLIIKMVAAGHGRKSGHGVYQYDEAGQRVPNSGLKASAL
jgi:3-hydroxybutyryl-CoA dehydrogenase